MPGQPAVPGELLTGLGPFFAVSTHAPRTPPVPPWRPASELTGPTGTLRARIESVRAALATRGGTDVSDVEPRVAASAVHLGLAARLTAPALGAAVLGRPLDMRPGGLWWQDAPGGPVPLCVPAATTSRSEDRAAGRDARDWDGLLLDQLLAPLTLAITRLLPVSRKVLWGNVASAVNAAAAQVATRRPDLAGDAWQAAGQLFRSPWLHGELNPPGPAFRRSSCCLFYRLVPGSPAAVCGDCVLTRRPAR